MLLPPELWDYVLTFLPADDLQRTSLSLTRALPSAEVSTSLLWRNLKLTREGQAWQAIHKLRHLDQGVKGAVKTVKATAFREDPQQLVNLLLALPSAESLHLNVGPLFSPEQLDELLLPSSALTSRRFHKLSSLSFRFNPYCMERSYFVFLKGTYFDSIVHNLARFTNETAPRLSRLEFVQDLSPNHGSKKKKETPAFGLHELRQELDNVEAEMDLRIDASRQPPASGKFTRKSVEENGKMDFAQPIVFFRLDCLANFSISPIGQSLTSLTLRLPRRNLLPALTLQTSPSNPPFPSLVHLDLSTTHILDDARLPTLLRLYPTLESLVIDRCTGLISEEAVQENTAIQTLRWLGKICAGIGLTRSEEVSRNWKRIVKERPTDAPNLPRSARLRSTSNTTPSTPSTPTIDSLVPPVKELFVIPPPPRLSSLGAGLHELSSPSVTRLWSKSFSKGYIEAIEKSSDKIEELLDRWELWDRTGKLKDGTRRLCTFKDALSTTEYKALHFDVVSDEKQEDQEDPDPLFEKFCQSRQLVSISPSIALDLLELNKQKLETFKVCFVPDCGNLAGVPRLSLNSNGKDSIEDRENREKAIEEMEKRERAGNSGKSSLSYFVGIDRSSAHSYLIELSALIRGLPASDAQSSVLARAQGDDSLRGSCASPLLNFSLQLSMPLSAEHSLASTTTEEAVELYWELLVKYRGNSRSGSPADYLVTWPTVEHVKRTARELSDQRDHYGVSKVIAVAGAAGRILWRPALSNGSNSITFSRSKLSIYTRSKRDNPGYDAQWASWLYLQSAIQLFTTNSPPVLLATHAALPRQLPITPYPRNDKPSWRDGFFNVYGLWSVKNEQVNTQIVFTVLQRPTPAFLLGKINTDDRADGSPSCTDQIDIKLELKPIGNRDPLDSFSCVFQVKIMQRIMPDGQPGEWIPWVPDDMYIKPEPERQTEPRIKRESRSPGRRSRSPSRSPSAGPSRVKAEPTIKQEPSYTLSHRKRAIYRRFEAAGGLGRF